MLELTLNTTTDGPLNVLCLGAHSDDIEIGCGGTLLKLIRSHPAITVYWVVFASNDARAREATESANLFLRDVYVKTIVVKQFRDGYFPYQGSDIKDFFEVVKKEFTPDIIFTHYRDDRHQDHRLISDLTWNTFRNHLILEYEIPKYDGDLGSPNLFVHLDETLCANKVNMILQVFATQRDKHWLSEDTLRAMMRIRGVESVSTEGFAEGFYCRKIIVAS